MFAADRWRRRGGGQPDRGSITLLAATSGIQIARVTANGAVVAAVPDGRAGWFVGGSFTRLGGLPRVALAHLLPNGDVDPVWRASVGSASGRPVAINVLARAGSRLFVAGPFGRVGGLQRPGLAAIDARTGIVLRRWSPHPLAWPEIAALSVAGPRLLVARQFTYPTPGITALDVRTGAVDRRWNPHLLLIGDAGSFNTMLVHSSRVYVAGSFHVAALQ
nr:delta-60 repeat domain-containing protein [Actinomycetota bacterium]